jgi:hypothetical protein
MDYLEDGLTKANHRRKPMWLLNCQSDFYYLQLQKLLGRGSCTQAPGAGPMDLLPEGLLCLKAGDIGQWIGVLNYSSPTNRWPGGVATGDDALPIDFPACGEA